MIVIFFLILLSLLIATGFLAAFVWAVRSGQFEDTCTPSLRLLLEDPPAVGRSNGSLQASGIPGASRTQATSPDSAADQVSPSPDGHGSGVGRPTGRAGARGEPRRDSPA